MSVAASGCSNGIDDDADGLTDFPADPDCLGWPDETEQGPAPDSDGDGIPDNSDACPANPDLSCTDSTPSQCPPAPVCSTAQTPPPSAVAMLSRLKLKRATRGAKVTFTVSAGATVKLTLQRCAKPKGKAGCKRWKRITTKAVTAQAGTNKVWLLGARRLKRGRYRVTARPVVAGAVTAKAKLRVRRR